MLFLNDAQNVPVLLRKTGQAEANRRNTCEPARPTMSACDQPSLLAEAYANRGLARMVLG